MSTARLAGASPAQGLQRHRSGDAPVPRCSGAAGPRTPALDTRAICASSRANACSATLAQGDPRGSRRASIAGHSLVAARSSRRCQTQFQRRGPVCSAAVAATQAPVANFAGLELCQQDFVAAAVSAAGAMLVVKVFDVLAKTGMMDRKLTRKGIHILCGPGFVATWVLFSASSGAPVLASLVPAFNGLRLLLIGTGLWKNDSAVKSISREGDPRELLRGPLYYVIVMCVGTLVFWRTSAVAVVAIAAMCGGDGMADVIGRRFGKGLRLPFNQKKSVAGSVAMFVSTIVLSLGLMWLLASFGFMSFDVARVIGPLSVAAFASTLVEALPISGYLDDNISVPLTAAIAVRPRGHAAHQMQGIA